jgi:hypothetical protein
MSFKGGCDLGQLSLSVSPCCLFVRRQCCRKLEATIIDWAIAAQEYI